MKAKLFYALAIIISICSIGLGVYLEINKKEEPKEFTYMPVFHRICDNDSCVYVLGSIHLGDDRITKFNKKVIDAYNSTDTLVVELDTTNETLDLNDYLLEDGKTIEEFIDEDLKEKLLNFQEKHPFFQYDTYKYYNLGFLYTIIVSMSYVEAGYSTAGVDDYFLRLAHNDNKEIIELETFDQQMNLLTGYSNEYYIDAINQLIDTYELTFASIKSLYEAYISANTGLLKIYLTEQEGLSEEEQQFNDALYLDRNISMSDEVKKLLAENKNAFVVVGSAHVIGENGIIENLKDDYKIELIKN